MIAYSEKTVRHGPTDYSSVAVAFAAIMLHYLLTPAESGTSPLAIVIRLSIVLACAGIVVVLARGARGWTFLIPFILSICSLILMINFPATTWYVLIFAGLVGGSLVNAMGFVSEHTRALFIRALDVLLGIWIGLFLIQFLTYFTLGLIIDFHNILYPYSQARIMGVMQESIFRMSGAHIEPGTHANWVYGAVLLRALSRGRLFDGVNLLVMLTVVLTYSFWGTIAAAIFVVAAVLSAITTMRLSLLVKLLTALLLCYGVAAFFHPTILEDVAEYLVLRADLDDGSGSEKLHAYRGASEAFWSVFAVGAPITFDFCDGCESPEDAGLFINLVMRLGFVPTMFLFAVIASALFAIGGIVGIIVLIPLLFVKFFYYEPMFWMIFGVSLLNWRRSHGHRTTPFKSTSNHLADTRRH